MTPSEPPPIQQPPAMAMLLWGMLLNPLMLYLLFQTLVRRIAPGNNARSSVYNLDHARLNVVLPPSLWMNMGFWTAEQPPKPLDPLKAPRLLSFPDACQTLLEQALIFAGFTVQAPTSPDAAPIVTAPVPGRRLVLLDAGTGCADQSLCLLRARRPESAPLVDRYIGMTADPAQAACGAARVRDLLERTGQTGREVHMLCADAAQPASWARADDTAAAADTDTWLLGLDSLYHFAPSRLPLLQHAHSRLGASLVAFDLALSPTATLPQRLLLRALCPLLGVPWRNMHTPDAYGAMLRQAGYGAGDVRMRDVSAHVFPGLAAFLARRDRELAAHGLGGLGRLRAAGWLFAWWARSGVVRGYLVVARARTGAGAGAGGVK